MAVAKLTRLWLTPLADPTAGVAIGMLWGSGMTWPNRGEVRSYANGRTRAITAPGVAQRWEPKLRPVPLTGALALVRASGTEHVARDPLGQKVLCVWFDPGVTYLGNRGGGELVQLDLLLEAVTWSEAV